MIRNEMDKVCEAWLNEYEDGDSFCLWAVLPDAFAAGAKHGAEQERLCLIALLMEHWGTPGELAGCSRVIRLIEARMQEVASTQATDKEKP